MSPCRDCFHLPLHYRVDATSDHFHRPHQEPFVNPTRTVLNHCRKGSARPCGTKFFLFIYFADPYLKTRNSSRRMDRHPLTSEGGPLFGFRYYYRGRDILKGPLTFIWSRTRSVTDFNVPEPSNPSVRVNRPGERGIVIFRRS